MEGEKMREEFEEWASTHEIRCAWDVWKASRESLVIDLTNCVANVHDGGAYYDQCMVDGAIEAAGLKVKP